MKRRWNPLPASNVREIDHYDSEGLMLCEGIILHNITSLHVFERATVNGARYWAEVLESHVCFIRGAAVPDCNLMENNKCLYAVRSMVFWKVKIWLNYPVRSPEINPIKYVWDALGEYNSNSQHCFKKLQVPEEGVAERM